MNSEHIVRRVQPTQIDRLKFLIMPRSPYSKSSWMPEGCMIFICKMQLGVYIAFCLSILPGLFALGILLWLGNASFQWHEFAIAAAIFISFSIVTIVVLALTNPQLKNFWVVEQRDRFIAYASIRSYQHFSVLEILRVLRKWRRQGLGSVLVSTMLQNYPKPVYLRTRRPTAKFYRRLGFRKIPLKQLSPRVKAGLGILDAGQTNEWLSMIRSEIFMVHD
ncbi:GNAT family N-acetyltransferase [Acaryochloris sp. IP29b_bin.137]|uniref:GNAT family N-acetyltransferase n=1 Tax=Acaryochloris sp. IP29b_bin.137 TaxID=2969217 RepID=UPI00262B1343|nr:GNAT family N-acetyltransferase [Acaryochloris sp. IP29b_bin.137]